MENIVRHRAVAVATVLAVFACGGGEGDGSESDSGSVPAMASSSSVDLTGAGATFAYPIYSKWFSEYAAATGVRINYQSIGSGGGVRQISEQTVDFGATDAPMSDEEIAKAKGGRLLHFPTVVGGIAVTYNLPGVSQPLRLTGDLIARIFLGRVTKWNDPAIAALNPGVALPTTDLIVVHRSDGSGTTYVFTDFLSTVNRQWASGPGRGLVVSWPVGLGGKGNEGVAGQVKQTPGAFGYIELAYAKQNRLPVALVRNTAGTYVAPTIATISEAADSAVAKLAPDTDYRVTLVPESGANAYPISSLTWLLVYETPPDASKGQKLVDFMRWMYGAGQASAASLDYAPLPGTLAQRLTERLSQIKIGAPK